MKILFTVFVVAILSLTAISTSHLVFAIENVVFTDKGQPNQYMGNNGDFYVDASTGHYYLKSNGIWIASSQSAALGVLQEVPALKPTSSAPSNTGSQIVNSQGGILANGISPNYVQPSTIYCFHGTLSVQGFCVDLQGHVLYSQPSSALQSSAGLNNLCSTGLTNSQGLCINGANSQGGILNQPNYSTHSNTHWCSTGLVNARGLCMNSINSENNIFPPSAPTNPTFLSQNSYASPYNTQSSFGSPDVSRSQILTIPGMNSPATINSQGGLYGHN